MILVLLVIRYDVGVTNICNYPKCNTLLSDLLSFPSLTLANDNTTNKINAKNAMEVAT